MANLFDDLVWDASVPGWSGSSTFNGHEIAIDIELDEVDPPSSTELENAKAAVECLYQKLTPTHETELRMATASELTHGAYSQSDYEPTDEDVAKLFQDIQLKSLSFTYSCQEDSVSGILSYLAPNEFPDWNLHINFRDDLSVDEVMAIEPD